MKTKIFISEDQDEAEREFIAGSFRMLNILQDGGSDASQAITSLLAKLCMDQPAPHQALKVLLEGTRAKMTHIRSSEK